MKFTTAAKFHLIGQGLAMFAQMVVPQIGLDDHLLHLVLALLAYMQGMAGQWAVFVQAQVRVEPPAPKPPTAIDELVGRG